MQSRRRARSVSLLLRPGFASQKGFLGWRESLLVVRARDRRTLRRLGVSPRDLAGRLEGLLEAETVVRDMAYGIRADDLIAGRKKYHDELIRRMEEMTDDEMGAMPDRAHVGVYEVWHRLYMGSQACPWTHTPDERASHYPWNSIDWTIRNLRSGRELTGPGLIVHLIRDHGFFEGRRSPYRVDPRALAELLELV